MIQYKNERGRSRRLSLGSCARMNIDQARSLAKQHFGKIVAGADPSQQRKQLRAELTASDLCDMYLTEARGGRLIYRGKPKKIGTVRIDESRIKRHIKPMIGQLAIREVSRRDVYGLLKGVSIGKTAVDERT